jgi:hypothetical protein
MLVHTYIASLVWRANIILLLPLLQERNLGTKQDISVYHCMSTSGLDPGSTRTQDVGGEDKSPTFMLIDYFQ